MLLEGRPVVILEAAYLHREIKVAEGSPFTVRTSGQLIFRWLQVPFTRDSIRCFRYLGVDGERELLHALIG